MRITVLVAKFDDYPGEDRIAFAPNCALEFVEGSIPVVRNLDARQPPIGRLERVTRQGPNVFAELELWGLGIVGTYPIVGGQAVKQEIVSNRWRRILRFRLAAIGLTDQPNADPRIPAIGMVSLEELT